MQLFRLTATQWTAIAAIINAILVAVLAVLNFYYMRSAARQAEAATKQADAADRQASAAFENIKLLKEQTQDQTSLKVTETLIDFRHMSFLIAWWSPKLRENWADLPPFDKMLPDNWPSMVHVVENYARNQRENLKSIETRIRNAEMLINGEMARKFNIRQRDVLTVAANDLDEAAGILRSVTLELENRNNVAKSGTPPIKG